MMDKLLKQLGLTEITHEQQEYFIEAFTHRSAVNKLSKYSIHNERLEFLGDAVLEIAVTEYLFRQFPDEAEGVLTTYRSALVKKSNLADVARKIGVGQYLIMSAAEKKSGGANKDYLLANTMEALIGAIYLTIGREMAEKFVLDFIVPELDTIIEEQSHIDAKSQFQELAQAPNIAITPHYQLVLEEGKDHDKEFVMAAYLGKKKVGEGRGRSKKTAQAAAAQDALDSRGEWMR